MGPVAPGGGEEDEANTSRIPPHLPTPTEIERMFSSPPTRWEWSKIERRPRPDNTAGRKADLLRRMARRDARKPLTITVSLRGGPECWWQVEARGHTYRFPGHYAIHDCLMWICVAQRWGS